MPVQQEDMAVAAAQNIKKAGVLGEIINMVPLVVTV